MLNHIVAVFQYMAWELIAGVFVGLIAKEIIKLNARRYSNMQVFSLSEYSSPNYGDDFPKLNFFNIFNLRPKLVIVYYQEDQIVREDFYTILGDRTTTIYQNGTFERSYWELWGLPIYACTAVAPMFIGFFGGVLFFFVPSLEPFFTYSLISGFIWISPVSILYPILYRESE